MPHERNRPPVETGRAASDLLGGGVEDILSKFGLAGDVPSERALLGCCLLAPGEAAGLLDGLGDHDWTEPRHVAVAAGIAAALAAGDWPDPVTVRSAMIAGGHVSAMTSDTDAGVFLFELEASTPSAASAWSYRRAVLAASWRRCVIWAAVRMAQAAERGSDDRVNDAVGEAMRAVARARARIDAPTRPLGVAS